MPQQATRTIVITNPQGLHARPAHAFVELASRYQATVTITKGGETVDGKSILSILTLAAVQGTELSLSAEGADADAALEALAQLLENDDEKPAAV